MGISVARSHFIYIVIMNRVLILAAFAAVIATASADCGKRFHNQHLETMQQWIVGGVQALKGGYPYQVSFEYVGWFGSRQHICGATIFVVIFLVGHLNTGYTNSNSSNRTHLSYFLPS